MSIERHHRKPKSRGGSNHPSNISRVERRKHLAFHTLFTKNGHPMSVHEIAVELNRVWIDPEWTLIPKPKR
uniref:Uncharacterized protein n=1 Tax=uncultured marine virus TaxID=186617 RepID=A0A0F7L9D1_9VIRU|nr:hypothetical protein [uncultured marine virus]